MNFLVGIFQLKRDMANIHEYLMLKNNIKKCLVLLKKCLLDNEIA